jgi:hypothetical protein
MSSYTIVLADSARHISNPRIIDDVQIKSLEQKVNKLLAEGWSCLGGAVICFNHDGSSITKICQTMVR